MLRMSLLFCVCNALMINCLLAQDFAARSSEKPKDLSWGRSFEDNEALPYPHIEERDVTWSKRIWRELDLREKMNHYFNFEPAPLIQILLLEAKAGRLDLYNGGYDDFRQNISYDEVLDFCVERDTVEVYDPLTGELHYQAVVNDFNPWSIRSYRIKEDWYFDKNTSRLGVRILGIAPLVDIKGPNGELLGQTPLFWLYYPQARNILAKHAAYNPHNDAGPMSWEDMLELRFFASYIVKESNIFDRSLKDYKQGLDVLREGEKIKEGIFNFEQDLWEH